MRSLTSAAVALASLVSSGLVAAAPAPAGGWLSNSSGWAGSVTTVTPTYTVGSFPTEVSADGDKFRFPLSNNFPTPDTKQINMTGEAAGGTLPNGPPPPSIDSDGIANLQLIAFNELFEVAFFTSLVQNVSGNVAGYEVPEGFSRDFLIDTLVAVQAQEQLHALNANDGLVNVAKTSPISPCEYVFPTTNLVDAIALAQKFTDVVLGTLQDVAQVFADGNDATERAFVRGIAAVIGTEGEQNGFYRALQGLRPTAQPFLTASARDFAFSALNQNFVVPGSCPDLEAINLEIFEPLMLLTERVLPQDQLLRFSFSLDETEEGKSGYGGGDDVAGNLQIVFINGQNAPIVEELQNVSVEDGVVRFEAQFDFVEELLFGLTIAAVTEKGARVGSVDEVADDTLFGPALIEVL